MAGKHSPIMVRGQARVFQPRWTRFGETGSVQVVDIFKILETMTALPNLRSAKGLVTDLEKQVEGQDIADSNDDPRLATLQALFEFTPEQMLQVRALPSSTYWCRHIEECFQPLLTEQYADVWKSLGFPQPKVTAQCWGLFQAVSKVVMKLDDSGYSVEDIWESTRILQGAESSQNVLALPAVGDDDQCFSVIFAMICWSTMIFQPELMWNKATLASCLAIQHPPAEPQSLKRDFVQRPIPAVFRNFQRALIRRRLARKPTKDGGTTLFVSTINYHSLRTIGKVRFRWVNDLSRHLSFDSKTRTLSVFGLPSFCACTTVGGDRDVLSEELVRVSFSTNDEGAIDNDCNSLQLSQEVLMSYRLLFGQSQAARKVGKSLLRKLESKGQYDQLLVCLCTKSQKDVNNVLPPFFWPLSCRDFNEKLQEAESYSSQDDFPILGCRLAVLQDFNSKQQPSRLRDLWRDRRNPLQWYTFWAVLVIGGISNIVAILQLAVAIAQILASK